MSPREQICGAAETRARRHQNSQQIAAWQAEHEGIIALRKQLAELELSKSQLSIRATMSGQVIADELESFHGRFVRAGTELFSIGDPQRKEAIALVSQRDAESLNRVIGKDAQLRIRGVGLLTGQVSEIQPRARDELPHPAFAGSNGGPLPVVARKQVERTESDDLMLVQPRIRVTVALSNSISDSLAAGQTGQFQIRSRQEFLASFVVRRIHRWISDRIELSHGL